MIAVMICRGSTSDRRAKNQRKTAVDKPRTSCCGRPSRSTHSSTVMNTAEAATKKRKRRSMRSQCDRLSHWTLASIERDELPGNATIGADLLIRDEEQSRTYGDHGRIAFVRRGGGDAERRNVPLRIERGAGDVVRRGLPDHDVMRAVGGDVGPDQHVDAAAER